MNKCMYRVFLVCIVGEMAQDVKYCGVIPILFGWFLRVLALHAASFPGYPRARMKNRKERGEPGKIYHVRNVICRENLIFFFFFFFYL